MALKGTERITVKKVQFFVYDVMQSLSSPSEYNLLVSKEYK